MTRIVVKELIWDHVNTEHIHKHNVSEIEVVEASKHIIYHTFTYSSRGNKRYLIVGRADKRLLAIIVRRYKLGTYYVVSARDAGKKERKKVYEKEKIK